MRGEHPEACFPALFTAFITGTLRAFITGDPSPRTVEECDESGDHRTRALQMVQFDAVKPRWSRAHSGDHHIFDLPTQPRARLAHGGVGGQS